MEDIERLREKAAHLRAMALRITDQKTIEAFRAAADKLDAEIACLKGKQDADTAINHPSLP
jgi:hypothetical protein